MNATRFHAWKVGLADAQELGRRYSTVNPPHDPLSDEQIANALGP